MSNIYGWALSLYTGSNYLLMEPSSGFDVTYIQETRDSFTHISLYSGHTRLQNLACSSGSLRQIIMTSTTTSTKWLVFFSFRCVSCVQLYSSFLSFLAVFSIIFSVFLFFSIFFEVRSIIFFLVFHRIFSDLLAFFFRTHEVLHVYFLIKSSKHVLSSSIYHSTAQHNQPCTEQRRTYMPIRMRQRKLTGLARASIS